MFGNRKIKQYAASKGGIKTILNELISNLEEINFTIVEEKLTKLFLRFESDNKTIVIKIFLKSTDQIGIVGMYNLKPLQSKTFNLSDGQKMIFEDINKELNYLYKD